MSDDEKLRLKHLKKNKQHEIDEHQGVQQDAEQRIVLSDVELKRKEEKYSGSKEKEPEPKESNLASEPESKVSQIQPEDLGQKIESKNPDTRVQELPASPNALTEDQTKKENDRLESKQNTVFIDKLAKKELVNEEIKRADTAQDKSFDEKPRDALPLGLEPNTQDLHTKLETRADHKKEEQEERVSEIPILEHPLDLLPVQQLDVQSVFRELNAVEVYISARYDTELVHLLEEQAHIKPYQSVRNELSGKTQSEHAFEQTKIERVTPAPIELKIGEKTQTEERGVSGIYCDNERFVAVLPVPIAEKLAEFQQIEPETIEFLAEKYAYLQEYLPQSELDRVAKEVSVHTLKDAAVHSKEQMKPQRKNPLREQRAEEQIVIIQQEITETQCTPKYMDYMIITYDCDCRDGYYVFWGSEIVGWEKQWLVVQPRIEERITKEPQHSRSDIDRDDHDR